MARLYVGKLHPHCGEPDLERFFQGYGTIENMIMKVGYAFVDIDDPREAEDAVYDLDGKELCGRCVAVAFAQGSERGIGGRPLSQGGRRRRRRYSRGRESADRRRSRSRSPFVRRQQGRERQRKRQEEEEQQKQQQQQREEEEQQQIYRQQRGELRDEEEIRKSRHRHQKKDRTFNLLKRFSMVTEWRLRVENLPSCVEWQDLKDEVRPYAEATYVDAHHKEEGVGFLCFATQSDLHRVMAEMNGMKLAGRRILLVDQSDHSDLNDYNPPSRSSRQQSPSLSYRQSSSSHGSSLTYTRRSPSPSYRRIEISSPSWSRSR